MLRSPRWVVALREKDGDRQLHLFLAREAIQIALQLAGIEPPRPWSGILTARLLTAVGAAVEQVTITDLVDDIYLASIDLRSGRKHSNVDARPSDAINLALALHAPIYVAAAVMARHGIPGSEAHAKLLTYGNRPEPDGVELEWVSQVELHKRWEQEGRRPFARRSTPQASPEQRS